MTNPLATQEGGDHYRTKAIQPVEYIHANNIPFIEGCIIKYASRWREKGGIKDLKKIIHFAEILIHLETTSDPSSLPDADSGGSHCGLDAHTDGSSGVHFRSSPPPDSIDSPSRRNEWVSYPVGHPGVPIRSA